MLRQFTPRGPLEVAGKTPQVASAGPACDAPRGRRSASSRRDHLHLHLHVCSTESLWPQYSRYFHADDLALETSASQPYARPDPHVAELQANLSF